MICAVLASDSALADVFEEATTVHASGQLSTVLSHNNISCLTLPRKTYMTNFAMSYIVAFSLLEFWLCEVKTLCGKY